MTEHERRERLAVRATLKAILGIPGDDPRNNLELARHVEAEVAALRSQSEAYELAAILRDRGALAGGMDQ